MADRFLIDGGDGDQSFFGTPQYLGATETDWFHGTVGDWYGKALLFVVEQGSFEGRYVALTSRWTETISEQLERNRMASVVVHLIENPSEGFDDNFEGYASIGMSVIELMD